MIVIPILEFIIYIYIYIEREREINTYMHAYVHAYVCVYICIYTFVYIYIYIYTHTYIYIYIYMLNVSGCDPRGGIRNGGVERSNYSDKCTTDKSHIYIYI